MDLTQIKANLAICSSDLKMPFLKEEEQRETYLNANLLCSNIFVFKKPLDMEACYIPYFFQEIDWNRAMNADEEWMFMLNRQEYLIDLANAYVTSKNLKYLDCWKRLVFDWIKNNPFDEWKIHTSWRTIDTGIRCSSWIKSMRILYEHLQDDELNRIFSSLKKQVLFLRNQYMDRYTLSNWGALQMSGILQTAMICEDLIPKKDVEWAWEELERQCEIQFHRDGVHWEQSPLYHFEVMFALADIYRTARMLDIPLPFELEGTIKKAVKAAYYMVYPNGYLVPQHDSDYAFIADVYSQMAEFLELEMPESFTGNDSGNFVYKTEKDFVSIWNGRHGSGHGHASLGHLNLFMNGERVLCDSGRFTYQEGPLRTLLKSAQSHSTVLVNDIPFMSIKDSWSYDYVGKALGNRVQETEEFFIVESTFSHVDYVVQRMLVYCKNDEIAIVIDYTESQGVHTMNRYFQLNPEINASKDDKGWVLTGKKNTIYTYFPDNGHTSCFTSLSSSIYNELSNRTTLIAEKQFENSGIDTAIFSSQSLEVSKHQIKQCGSGLPAADEIFLGFRLQLPSSSYDVYFAANDTVKGEKVYKHNEVHLYHKLTIIHNGQKTSFF